jgi:hypothetical protein
MNIRGISMGLAVAAALGAGSALAQQQDPVAKLADIEGNVLVSQGDAMVAGSNGQRVAVGTRVVSTAGAKVTINYDFGCDVRLKENERFTVNLGACAALLAQVVPVGPAAGAIGGGTIAAAGGTATALPVGATMAGVAILGANVYGAYETFRNRSVSPN